jgi:hypothetical protein
MSRSGGFAACVEAGIVVAVDGMLEIAAELTISAKLNSPKGNRLSFVVLCAVFLNMRRRYRGTPL